MTKNYLKLSKIFMLLCFLANTTVSKGETVVTITPTPSTLKLVKKYICSTLSSLFSLGSGLVFVRIVLGIISVCVVPSLTDTERTNEIKSVCVIGLPALIVLERTGDFLKELANT